MRKNIIVLVVILIVTSSVIYMYSKVKTERESTQEDRGFELIERALDGVEVEAMSWVEKVLYIKGGDKVYKYERGTGDAEELLLVNVNSTIGSKDSKLIICSWENRVILNENEYATAISIKDAEGTELTTFSFKDTYKVDICEGEILVLSNAYPFLEEQSVIIGWDGQETALEQTKEALTIGNEETINIYKGTDRIAQTPLVNYVEFSKETDNAIAIYTETNQVWVIYLNK